MLQNHNLRRRVAEAEATLATHFVPHFAGALAEELEKAGPNLKMLVAERLRRLHGDAADMPRTADACIEILRAVSEVLPDTAMAVATRLQISAPLNEHGRAPIPAGAHP